MEWLTKNCSWVDKTWHGVKGTLIIAPMVIVYSCLILIWLQAIDLMGWVVAAIGRVRKICFMRKRRITLTVCSCL